MKQGQEVLPQIRPLSTGLDFALQLRKVFLPLLSGSCSQTGPFKGWLRVGLLVEHARKRAGRSRCSRMLGLPSSKLSQ